MACRKDGKGRVLRKGEHYRKTDGRYSYIYTDPLGKTKDDICEISCNT